MHNLITQVTRWTPTRDELGMTTSEYAVGTVGACGVGGILYTLASSGWFQDLVKNVIDDLLDVLPF
ncbi:hypothetical protein BH24ACT11_BH24ACT11_09470 [soil metagenome]